MTTALMFGKAAVIFGLLFVIYTLSVGIKRKEKLGFFFANVIMPFAVVAYLAWYIFVHPH